MPLTPCRVLSACLSASLLSIGEPRVRSGDPVRGARHGAQPDAAGAALQLPRQERVRVHQHRPVRQVRLLLSFPPLPPPPPPPPPPPHPHSLGPLFGLTAVAAAADPSAASSHIPRLPTRRTAFACVPSRLPRVPRSSMRVLELIFELEFDAAIAIAIRLAHDIACSAFQPSPVSSRTQMRSSCCLLLSTPLLSSLTRRARFGAHACYLLKAQIVVGDGHRQY